MHPEQKIYEKLLQITAESRFRTFKAIWNLTPPSSGAGQNSSRDLISQELTRTRTEIFKKLTSIKTSYTHPIIRAIAETDGISIVKNGSGEKYHHICNLRDRSEMHCGYELRKQQLRQNVHQDFKGRISGIIQINMLFLLSL